jgi:hypothetical protein
MLTGGSKRKRFSLFIICVVVYVVVGEICFVALRSKARKERYPILQSAVKQHIENLPKEVKVDYKTLRCDQIYSDQFCACTISEWSVQTYKGAMHIEARYCPIDRQVLITTPD